MLAEKVVKFENESSKIYDQVNKWLNNHAYNSERTRRDYEFDVKLFFKLMKQKEITYLTKEDVQLTLDDFEDFINKLYTMENEKGERNYSNKTINRKVAAVKGMIKYLAGKKLDGEYIVKDVAYMGLINSLPENSKSHGILESHEIIELSQWAKTEKHKGLNKSLAIIFAFNTCARKSDVLNAKWSDFVEKEEGVLVKGIGKGNKEFREMLSKNFYNELLALKKDGEEKVFDLTDKNIDDMMNRARKSLGYPSERNIVFHSIRKGGATWRFKKTGDIMEAKRALNHSNLNTTQIYLKEEDYGIIGDITADQVNEELYKEVDIETLIEAIGELKKGTQLLLNMKIQELLKKK